MKMCPQKTPWHCWSSLQKVPNCLMSRAAEEAVTFPDPSRGGVSVAVVVRAKPPSPADSPVIVEMTKKSTTIRMPAKRDKKGAEKTFNFDRCYWSVAKSDPNYASQEDVFAEVGHFAVGENLI